MSRQISRSPMPPLIHSKGRINARTTSSGMSSPEGLFHNHQWGNAHPAMSTSKQTLGFQSKKPVVDNLKLSLSSSSSDNDEFDELGPSIQHSRDSDSDLATEMCKGTKPTVLPLGNESTEARKTRMQQCPEGISHLNENNISRNRNPFEKNNYPVSSNQTHRTISIDKVPVYISPLNLREAASSFGEVLSASLQKGPGRLNSCHIEFKSVESKERMLAARRISVKNFELPIRDLHVPEYMTIRIGNISMETSEPSIHSMCVSCGEVAGLSRTKDGAVDVIFKVKSNLEPQTIMRRLNDVYYHECQWSAQLVPSQQQNSTMDALDSKWSTGSQINKQMEVFRKQYLTQRIYLEDLENLHYAVLHLRDRPADMNSQVLEHSSEGANGERVIQPLSHDPSNLMCNTTEVLDKNIKKLQDSSTSNLTKKVAEGGKLTQGTPYLETEKPAMLEKGTPADTIKVSGRTPKGANGGPLVLALFYKVCKFKCCTMEELALHTAEKNHTKLVLKYQKSLLKHQKSLTAKSNKKAKKDKLRHGTPHLEAKKPAKQDKGTPKMCTICNIACTSQATLDDHLAGRKHMNSVKKQQEVAPVTT